MKKLIPSLLVAALLTACGGGGSDSPAAATSPSVSVTPTPPPAAAAPTPPPATASTVSTRPASPGISITAGSFNTGTSGSSFAVQFNRGTNLTATGDLNSFWLNAAEAGGLVTIGGNQNTIVFQPTAIPASVIVTGSANTFYMPEGSPIKLEGSGAAMSTIKFYKP